MTAPVPNEPWYSALIHGTTAVPKAAAKLIETVAVQIGLYNKPFHTRRMGQAEADVRIIDAKADVEITKTQLHGQIALRDIADRADQRLRQREMRRQRNLEGIMRQVTQHITEDVSDTPVDPDWTAQFFECCQDVSNEEMQSVWARILAGEVTNPGTFSRRTISIVRVLSRSDADLFTRFCSTIWRIVGQITPYIPVDRNSRPFKSIDLLGGKLLASDLFRLESCGLIRVDAANGFLIDATEGKAKVVPDVEMTYHDRRFRVKWKVGWQHFPVGVAILTVPGEELIQIAGAKADPDYLTDMLTDLFYRCEVIETTQEPHREFISPSFPASELEKFLKSRASR